MEILILIGGRERRDQGDGMRESSAPLLSSLLDAPSSADDGGHGDERDADDDRDDDADAQRDPVRLPSFFSYRVSCFTEILSLPSNLFLPIFWCLMPAPSMESIVNETRLAKARAAGRVVLDHAHLKAHLCGCVGVCVCVADVLYEPAAAAERFSALVRRPAVLRRRLRAAPQRPGEAGAGPHRRPPGAVKKAKKKIQPDKKIVFFLPTPTSRSLPTLCNYNRLCATLIGSSFPSAVSSLECSFFVVFF